LPAHPDPRNNPLTSMAPTQLLLFVLLFLQGKPVLGDKNVYGKPMTACGADHAAGCAYAEMDAGAHQVCVTKLPHGFSSKTGQGSWSDQYTGQPWCICIWAYSNYILQNKDLPLKCESIPLKVLEEQYSLDKFKQCGSMSSTDGCGPEDIRRSIQSLCQQCDKQAGVDEDAKSALKTKCNKILASAPAAPMDLYSTEALEAADGTVPHSIGGLSSLMSGLAVAGLLVTLLVRAFRNHGSQHRFPSYTSEDLLEAESVE